MHSAGNPLSRKGYLRTTDDGSRRLWRKTAHFLLVFHRAWQRSPSAVNRRRRSTHSSVATGSGLRPGCDGRVWWGGLAVAQSQGQAPIGRRRDARPGPRCCRVFRRIAPALPTLGHEFGPRPAPSSLAAVDRRVCGCSRCRQRALACRVWQPARSPRCVHDRFRPHSAPGFCRSARSTTTRQAAASILQAHRSCHTSLHVARTHAPSSGSCRLSLGASRLRMGQDARCSFGIRLNAFCRSMKPCVAIPF